MTSTRGKKTGLRLAIAGFLLAGATGAVMVPAHAGSPHRRMPLPIGVVRPTTPFGYHKTRWRHFPGSDVKLAEPQVGGGSLPVVRPPEPADEDSIPELFSESADALRGGDSGGASIVRPPREFDEGSPRSRDPGDDLPFDPTPPPESRLRQPPGGNLQGNPLRNEQPSQPGGVFDPFGSSSTDKSSDSEKTVAAPASRIIEPARQVSWDALLADEYEPQADLALDQGPELIDPRKTKQVGATSKREEEFVAKTDGETQETAKLVGQAVRPKSQSKPDSTVKPASAIVLANAPAEIPGKVEQTVFRANSELEEKPTRNVDAEVAPAGVWRNSSVGAASNRLREVETTSIRGRRRNPLRN